MTLSVQDYVKFLKDTKTPHHLFHTIKEHKNVKVINSISEIDNSNSAFLYRPNDTLLFLIKKPKNSIKGIRMVVTHSDSPCYKLKGNGLKSVIEWQKKLEESDSTCEKNEKLEMKKSTDLAMPNNLTVPIRPYGGGLFHTFMDRLLSFSGLIVVNDHEVLKSVLVDKLFTAIIPSLPPHLNHNSVYEPGKVKFEIEKAILVETGNYTGKDVSNNSESEIKFTLDQILSHDLSLIDTQDPAIAGNYVHSSRQDNLLSTFSAIHAILGDSTDSNSGENRTDCIENESFLKVVLVTDFEEIGSEKLEGARSHTVKTTWDDLSKLFEIEHSKTSTSLIASVDVSHAFNPNFSGHYDPGHQLSFGESVNLKRSNFYATDLHGESIFQKLCKKSNVSCSIYENRAGIRGGGTVGTMLSCLLGTRTVDIGTPVFAMHSVRELACWEDVKGLQKVLKGFLDGK